MAPLPNRKSVDKKRVYLVSPGFSSLCQTIVSVSSQSTTTILFSGLSGFSRLFLRVTLQTYLPCFKSILLFCTVYRKLNHTYLWREKTNSYFHYFVFSHEINFIRKKCSVLSGFTALKCISAPMATLVSIVTLVPTGQPPTPVNVFMLLGFFNLLSVSTCFILPFILLDTYDAYASLGRIEEFSSTGRSARNHS